MGNVNFRVKDDGYATFYKVSVSQFKNPKFLSVRCACPYNLSEICRHKAGALFHLQDLLDRNQLGNYEAAYDQKHTVVKMKQLDLKQIKMLSDQTSFEEASNFLRTGSATILEAKEERVTASLVYEGHTYQLLIQKNEERNFDTSCNCGSETEHPLCVHKNIIFLQLLNKFGPGYFDTIRNWDKEKNKLLALYGYALSDDLTGKFEFTYTAGKPFLRVLDTSIKRVALPLGNEAISIAPKKPDFIATEKETEKIDQSVPRVKGKTFQKLGLVISTNSIQYPFTQFDIVEGEVDEDQQRFLGKVEKQDLARFINTEMLDEQDKSLVQQLRKLMPAEVSR
jgi:non-specific serine/threonine protein kinase